MSEFVWLVHDAAGQPPRPLRMDEIRHRAARLGWRRRVGLLFVGIGVVGGIGAPTGLTLLPAGERQAQVETIEVDRDRREPPSVAARPEQAESAPPAASSDRIGAPPSPDASVHAPAVEQAPPQAGQTQYDEPGSGAPGQPYDPDEGVPQQTGCNVV